MYRGYDMVMVRLLYMNQRQKPCKYRSKLNENNVIIRFITFFFLYAKILLGHLVKKL